MISHWEYTPHAERWTKPQLKIQVSSAKRTLIYYDIRTVQEVCPFVYVLDELKALCNAYHWNTCHDKNVTPTENQLKWQEFKYYFEQNSRRHILYCTEKYGFRS
jgi:hypothetical protein